MGSKKKRYSGKCVCKEKDKVADVSLNHKMLDLYHYRQGKKNLVTADEFKAK
jgi:hypothetical protein